MRLSLALWGLAGSALADPTWPSDVDELEEIMYQLTSFRARKFADTVSPCTNEASGPGRLNAAEWLRTAFHDMSTANSYFKIGGLDGSLQYELTNSENLGPGHKTTLEFMSRFVSPKSSLADLVAMGVYTSVRSCGGPAVPIRAGRKDAAAKGPTGVPQPQNSIPIFRQQFERMGFTNEEMIQLTACGHTLGGVHQQEFPDLTPPGVKDGQAPSDSTAAVFDNKVVTEYLSGKTSNPLVVGPSVKVKRNSDFKIFNSDNNKTVEAMVDPVKFKAICKKVLQKMIDVVPEGVTLTDPIVPYAVKPVNQQLTLVNGGSALAWTGYIRVKTTGLSKGGIKKVSIGYKDRKGSADCGISPFTVTIHQTGGESKLYDNNGKGYPLRDDVLFQAPQSCIRGSTGALTVVAAVRNDVASRGAPQANIWYKVPQTNSPLPQLRNELVTLKKGKCVGKYTLFASEYTVQGGFAYESHVDVTANGQTDGFKSLAGIGGTCADTAAATAAPPTTTISPAAPPTTAISPAAPTVIPQHRQAIGGYKLASCWTEGNGTRALSGISFVNDTMTLEKCMGFCSAYNYWGTEYGRECYCGNSLSPSSQTAPLAECNMACGGNASDFCGAGNRLELYSTTSAPVTPTPTATLIHKPTVAPYTLVGCWAEGQSARALEQKSTIDKAMTNDACGTFCKDYKYFGTEYGSECYCGSFVGAGTQAAPLAECNMPCAGDSYQYCGASNRLELYMNANATGGQPEQPAAVGNYVLVGCRTEGNGTRALAGKTTWAETMTNAKCAEFCKDSKYFGTEYGRECYCGEALDASSKETPQKECGMLCGGSTLEYCGASNRLSVYTKKAATPPPPPAPPAPAPPAPAPPAPPVPAPRAQNGRRNVHRRN
ncbi:WSC domain containing protein [Ophiocordyceps sinensis CO18]|uniref:WSC domain containing protein n=1 Tax=Ophiocordyceps sinensis (strain Co18 / CGMCC 3.14243) TaxID=911162 RepID=T5ACE9_OPHSC|nr:WSC domain containing protein [Ophiocordyceps sinensis CO18]